MGRSERRRASFSPDHANGADLPVASGVYLYKLDARPAGSPLQEMKGKRAVLR